MVAARVTVATTTCIKPPRGIDPSRSQSVPPAGSFFFALKDEDRVCKHTRYEYLANQNYP